MATRIMASLAVLVCLVFAWCPATAGEIVVQPGAFDRFEIKMPAKLVAGESATIEITAVDAFGNVITTFADSKREFGLAATGSATVKPGKLPASFFQRGVATVSLSDTVAESISLTLHESGVAIPLYARDISIAPARISGFSVKAPRTAIAGERFDITLLANDAFGNVVTDAIPAKNIKLAFKGEGDPKVVSDSISDFRGGMSSLGVRSEKAGGFAVEVRDAASGSVGMSDRIEILPAALSAFRIISPAEIIAGEPFEIGITALDAYKNLIRTYSSSGTGVSLVSSGKAKPFPSIVSANEFSQGQTKVMLRYDTVEPTHEIILTVAEINGKATGLSKAIKVVPQVASKYVVTTPQTAVAGQRFPVKITVYNQVGNPMKHYNLSGPDVALVSTGSGRLTPSRIPASEFVNGVASVETQYDKSEAFSITAEQVKAGQIVVTPAPKGTQAKAASHKASESGKTTKAKGTKSKGTKPAKSKETKKSSGPAKSIISTPAMATVAKVQPVEVKTITLSETAQRSVIAVNLSGGKGPGSPTVKARSIKVSGKSWIMLTMSPAVNKMIEPVRFDSDVLGQVIVEEVKNGASSVIVKVEQKKGKKFKVDQTESYITVSVGR